MNWIETPLSHFGFKCIMSKHDLCAEQICECLCHEAAFDFSSNKIKTSQEVTEKVIWLNS